MGVVSMGRRNTQLKTTYREKQRLKPLAKVRSAGTLRWQGFDRARPNRLATQGNPSRINAIDGVESTVLTGSVYQSLSPSTREVPFAKKRRRAVHSREDVRPAILVFAICRKINADSNEVESDLVNCRGRDRAPCNVLQFQSLEVAQTAHSATRVSKTDSAGCTWFVLPEECSGAR